ncbi:MAG: SGNH/GDSL hydrolase family protein [Ktedonobacterales bacterium]
MRVLFLGDSLTEGIDGACYLNVVRERLDAVRTCDARLSEIELIGAGVGGDTVVNLARRLASDVTPHQPDWVVIQVGVNDCGTLLLRRSLPTRRTIHGYRYFVGYKGIREAITPQRFAEGLRVLVDAIRTQTLAQVAICSPTIVGELPRTYAWRLLDRYADVTRYIAAERNCHLIDVHAAFVQAVAELPKRPLAAWPVDIWRRHRSGPRGADYTTLARLRGYSLVYDGRHLTRRGAEVMASPIVDWLLAAAAPEASAPNSMLSL